MAYQQLKTSFDTFEIPSFHLWRDQLPALSIGNVYAALAIAVSSFVLLQIALLLSDDQRRKIDLPGPTGWPLIGVGLDLPKRPRKMLNEYRAKYGDAFKIRLGWYDWVFFNTPEAVKEVFDKQVGSIWESVCFAEGGYILRPLSWPPRAIGSSARYPLAFLKI